MMIGRVERVRDDRDCYKEECYEVTRYEKEY